MRFTSVIKDFIDDIYVLCVTENPEYMGFEFICNKDLCTIQL